MPASRSADPASTLSGRCTAFSATVATTPNWHVAAAAQTPNPATIRNHEVDTPPSRRWRHGAELAVWLAMGAAAAAESTDPNDALPGP